MQEERICCRGSSDWTRIIGWIYFVSSIIGLILVGVLLHEISLISPDDFAEAGGTGLTPGDREAAVEFLTVTAVTLVIMLAIHSATMAMAIVLLKGSYNRDPRYLHVWVVATAVMLILSQLIYLVQTFYSRNGGDFTLNFFTIFLTSAVGGFCICTVNFYKKEMETSHKRLHTVPA